MPMLKQSHKKKISTQCFFSYLKCEVSFVPNMKLFSLFVCVFSFVFQIEGKIKYSGNL